MGAYKQFLASDIIVTPFEVNKTFTFQGINVGEASSPIALNYPDVGIDRLLGRNITGSLFNTTSDPTTGLLGVQYQRLVYNSVLELYYSNYLSSSYGDQVSRPILIPGFDTEGDRLIGSASNQAYYNYPQTTLTYPKYFPTASDALVGVISIPVRLFGDYIQPNSFVFSSATTSGSLTDDGEGNILYQGDIVGNIFYPHGLIILTGNNSGSFGSGSVYGSAIYGSSIYGASTSFIDELEAFITSSNVTCSFSSSYTIYESQYKCTIRENEFNFTLNPSTISGSTEGTVYGFVTESYFSPYVTTVGLYDENQNLLAVGKLSQPVPTSPTTDTTILINIDR
jgi:hypothetical protein